MLDRCERPVVLQLMGHFHCGMGKAFSTTRQYIEEFELFMVCQISISKDVRARGEERSRKMAVWARLPLFSNCLAP